VSGVPPTRHAATAALLAVALGGCTTLTNLANGALASVGAGPIAPAAAGASVSLLIPYGTSVREACLRASAARFSDLDVSGPIRLSARDAGVAAPPDDAPAFVMRLSPAEADGGSFPPGDRLTVSLTPAGTLAPFLAVSRPLEIDGRLYYQPVVALSGQTAGVDLGVASPLEVWVSSAGPEGCFEAEFRRSR
jgi:hypothetical protein